MRSTDAAYEKELKSYQHERNRRALLVAKLSERHLAGHLTEEELTLAAHDIGSYVALLEEQWLEFRVHRVVMHWFENEPGKNLPPKANWDGSETYMRECVRDGDKVRVQLRSYLGGGENDDYTFTMDVEWLDWCDTRLNRYLHSELEKANGSVREQQIADAERRIHQAQRELEQLRKGHYS